MRRISLLLIMSVLPRLAFADGNPLEQDLHQKFLKGSQAEADAQLAEEDQARERQNVQLPPLSVELDRIRVGEQVALEKDTRSLIKDLVGQVESLKTTNTLTATSLRNTQTPQGAKFRGARTVFSYRDGQLYEISAATEHVVDIQLRPGETLTGAPTAGDKERWAIDAMVSGAGASQQTHLILKPLWDAIETNLIVTTNERVYHLRLKSGEAHMPSVSWTYPAEEKRLEEVLQLKNQSQEPTVNLDELCFDYEVSGDKVAFRPRQVFDDGSKTFLRMPSEMKAREAPAFFVMEGGEPLLVNYRVKGEYYVLDRIFDKAELKVGKDSSIYIERHPKKSFWDHIF